MQMNDHDYFKELHRVLLKDDIRSELHSNGRFVVLQDGDEVCRVAPTGEVLLNPGYTFGEKAGDLCHKASLLAGQVREYMQAYEQGAEFNQGYHLVCSCNHTALGVKKSVGGYVFVTWNQDPDGGYSNGTYTNSFENAKDDFVRLSGLIPHERLFTDQQLVELSRCVVDVLEGGYRMSFEQDKELTELLEQLQEAAPNYQQLLRESMEQSASEEISSQQTMEQSL